MNYRALPLSAIAQTGEGGPSSRGGNKKPIKERRAVIRAGPSGVTIVDAGCIERVAPDWGRCGRPLAADSGAFCEEHKIDVRRSV